MAVKAVNSRFVGLLIVFFYYLLVVHMLTGFITQSTFFCLLVILAASGQNYHNKNATVLLLYGLSLAVIMTIKGVYDISSVVDSILSQVCYYIFGKMVVDYYAQQRKNPLVFLLLMAFFFGAYFYLWTIIDVIGTNSLVSPQRWLVVEGTQHTATHIGTNVSIGLVGLSAFAVIRNNKIIKWCFLTIGLLSLLSVIHMVNRSGVVIAFLSIIIVLFFYYKKTSHFKTFVISALSVLILSIALYAIALSNDTFQLVVEAYAERETDVDESALLQGGGRTIRWADALSNIPTHPFGWESSSKGYNYAHNMWLDVAKDAGWLPFVLLIVITFRIISGVLKLQKKECSSLTCTLLGINVCMFSSAFVEPVLGGMFFSCYCVIWGFQERYYSTRRVR